MTTAKKKRFEIQPGNELRGMMIRLYPDKETIAKLHHLQSDTKTAWNWLVKQTEEILEAREALALRDKLVPPRPAKPVYEGLQPSEAKATKEAYIATCQEWKRKVYEATKDHPGCQFRKFSELLEHYGCEWDYQLMSKIIGWKYAEGEERLVKPNPAMLQALVRNYFTKSDRRKKIRRHNDPMPLQVKSKQCFEEGKFGTRRGNDFYDCQVSFNGLKIKGRLPGKRPEGRVLEGVSITELADGWWAAIKLEVPKRALPQPIPDTVIGIDVGLVDLAAMSDGTIIANPRGKELADRIARRQKMGMPTGRLHLQAARHTKHLIYNEIVKPLILVETLKIEKLSSKIGQMGSSKVSAMRLIVSMLLERYGSRVREVDCCYTSQDCSQCGHRSKESWSYEHGRYGECPICRYREHRDLNAARNIAAKPAISLVA